MTDYAALRAAVSDHLIASAYWKATKNLGRGYAVANPNEASALIQYISDLTSGGSPTPPTMTTEHGKGLLGMIQASLNAPVPTPTPTPAPTPSGWTIAAPGSTGLPITTRTGSNWFMSSQTLHDEQNTGGTSDSVYGLGDALRTPAITMQRVKIRNGVSVAGVSYGKHAIYGDHTGLIEDCDATVNSSGYAASVFSPRMGNQIYRRCWASNDAGTGGPFMFGIYDSEPDNEPGKPLRIEYCRGISSQDTCVWISTNPDKNNSTKIGLVITFDHCQFQGSAFCKVDMAAVQQGFSVTLNSCTLNNRAVVASDCPNVSPLYIDGVKVR